VSDKTTYEIHPIGTIRRNGDTADLEIAAAYRPALKQLDHFSHVMVFWWADRFDTKEGRSQLQCEPPYAREHVTGVFATRSPLRPNPIAMTTCKLLGLDEESGVVQVSNIDAFDGTRVVDLKAYFPVCDRVQDAHIPGWLSDWPEWMPEEGLDLEPWEQETEPTSYQT
jgi:tRNA-Thr(GGU) m(6)t(6)A37 methyltransferase TsaA